MFLVLGFWFLAYRLLVLYYVIKFLLLLLFLNKNEDADGRCSRSSLKGIEAIAVLHIMCTLCHFCRFNVLITHICAIDFFLCWIHASIIMKD